MKRAILISTIAAVTLTSGAGFALASGYGKMGEHHGQRGPMFKFEEVDANSDGKITQEEVAAHFKARFDAADTDKDGALSADEMKARARAAAEDRIAKRTERMLERRDADNDGKLTFEEMQPKKAGRMFERLDADSDGAISAEEFAQMQQGMGKRGHGEGYGEGHGHREGKMDHHGNGGHHGKGGCDRQQQ